jgi:hypothetical protein
VIKGANDLTQQFTSQLNLYLQDALAKAVAKINELLAKATSAIKNAIPLSAAKIDGYATINGNELERLHVQAEWTMKGKKPESESQYGASLDVTSWIANGKGASCTSPPTDGSGILDATISAYNLPIKIATSSVTLKKVYLGFTLVGMSPVAVFGGIETAGQLAFQSFKLFDLAFMAGLSWDGGGAVLPQNYLGAKGAAQVESVSMKAAFLVGQVCDPEVFQTIDPQVAEFVGLTEPFRGVFARAGASFPIWDNGCALTVGVGGNIGVWLLFKTASDVWGGVVGGEAWGEALCIASLKGAVTALGQYDGSFKFQGEGWGGAGVGACSPEDWHSVSDVRDDDWCGTGDAQFKATWQGSWTVKDVQTSAID